VVDAETGRELAKGEIVMVAYDYHAIKTIPIPQEWRTKMTEFEELKPSGQS
jgi:acyl-CoA thioesterase FadM